jgi:hypothetical protein
MGYTASLQDKIDAKFALPNMTRVHDSYEQTETRINVR